MCIGSSKKLISTKRFEAPFLKVFLDKKWKKDERKGIKKGEVWKS